MRDVGCIRVREAFKGGILWGQVCSLLTPQETLQVCCVKMIEFVGTGQQSIPCKQRMQLDFAAWLGYGMCTYLRCRGRR